MLLKLSKQIVIVETKTHMYKSTAQEIVFSLYKTTPLRCTFFLLKLIKKQQKNKCNDNNP